MSVPQKKLEILPEETSETEKILARFNIFEDFKNNPEVLSKFAKILKVKTFAPGAIIILEGETGSELFILHTGKVGVFKKTPSGDEYKVADLSDHMNVIFGEGAIIDIDTRSATIKSLSACECFVMDREDFDKFSKDYPQWALPVFKKISKAVMGRLRKTSQDFTLVYNALVAEIKGV
jgi:CRP-like cAMP-binding protein